MAAEHDEVKDAGGLYVLGTERHESRRIDNQLRGRSGRQGDPGESRFYLSLQDELMRLFKSDWVDRVLTTLKVPDDVPIENKSVTNSIASAQGQVESQNFDSRKNVLKYDDVMNRQREVIYGERRAVLEGADLHEQVRGMIDDVVDGYVTAATEGFPEEWDLDELWAGAASSSTRSRSRSRRLEEEAGGRDGLDPRAAGRGPAAPTPRRPTTRREESFGDEVMRELERRVLLSVLDRKWREHLYEMDYLREGIGLRAYSQRDPLVEYQREGFDMFARHDGRHQGGVGRLPVQPRGPGRGARPTSEEDEDGAEAASHGGAALARPRPRPAATTRVSNAKGLEQPEHAARDLTYSAPSEDGDAEVSGAADRQRDRRRPLRRGQPQRRVPLRLGQEVQEVPRRARGSRRASPPAVHGELDHPAGGLRETAVSGHR